MKTRFQHLFCLSLSGWLLLASTNLFARPLPTELTSALLLKAIELESRLGAKEALTIWVLGNRELYTALKGRRRNVIGSGNLERVESKFRPDEARPDVIFISAHPDIEGILKYAREHQILTVSDDISLASRGVAMVLYESEGLPGILLNVAVSKERGLLWKPELLEFAEPVY